MKYEPYQYMVQPMTMRDYFAAQALAGMWANMANKMTPEEAAMFAYQTADAMLALRVVPDSEKHP